MRRSLRASLLTEHLEKGAESPLLSRDPDLREMAALARSLRRVGELAIRPDPQRQAEIKVGLLQRREELLSGRAPRRALSPEPLLRPVSAGTRRYAWIGAAVFLLLAVSAASIFWFFGGGPQPPLLPGEEEAALALLLDAPATVEVRREGGGWEQRSGRVEIHSGDSLRTLDERVEVLAGEDALFRMDRRSEVTLASLEEGELLLLLDGGRVYHRVLRTFRYSVRAGEVVGSATGTAFSTERWGESGFTMLALHSESSVRHGDRDLRLSQGQGYRVEDAGDAAGQGTLGPIEPRWFEAEWLTYNLERDLARGFDAGVLPELLSPPPPPETPRVELRARVDGSRIVLQWDVAGGQPVLFEILRAVGSRTPYWPQDLFKTVRNPSARSFTDDSLAPGKPYTYRLSMLVGEDRVLSNYVTVSVPAEPEPGPEPSPPAPPPEPRILLQGRQVTDSSSNMAVRLDWLMEGDLQVDQWMVCRSSSMGYPVYPPEGSDSYAFPHAYSGKADSYTDEENIYIGYTYRYRIAALYQGKVVLYSNPVSVEVQTIIP